MASMSAYSVLLQWLQIQVWRERKIPTLVTSHDVQQVFELMSVFSSVHMEKYQPQWSCFNVKMYIKPLAISVQNNLVNKWHV
jgi:hypothetical protein